MISVISCASSENDVDVAEVKEQEKSDISIPLLPTDSLSVLCGNVIDIMADYESTVQSRATSAFIANECTVQAEKAIGQACSSYVLVGRQVQSELIANAEMAQFDQEAMLAVSNMTDDQLALAAMAITVLAEYDYERINNDQLVSNIYVDCLLDVIGVNDVISLIGTAVGTFAGGGGSLYAIIEGTVHADAKTMGKIFYKMAKRYAGWLGVGYMLLEYGQCINAHRA